MAPWLLAPFSREPAPLLVSLLGFALLPDAEGGQTADCVRPMDWDVGSKVEELGVMCADGDGKGGGGADSWTAAADAEELLPPKRLLRLGPAAENRRESLRAAFDGDALALDGVL